MQPIVAITQPPQWKNGMGLQAAAKVEAQPLREQHRVVREAAVAELGALREARRARRERICEVVLGPTAAGGSTAPAAAERPPSTHSR